jgi:uncharacterized membrane protein YphA (DoxX/SURF4 family)
MTNTVSTANRWSSIAARVVLGAMFLFSGINKLAHFAPMPPAPPAAGAFLAALGAAGYMFPLIAIAEAVGGALVLAGRALPLGLILLAPVTVNVLAYHAFLAPAGLAMPLVLVAAQLYLAWNHRAAFAPLFQSQLTHAEDSGVGQPRRVQAVPTRNAAGVTA